MSSPWSATRRPPRRAAPARSRRAKQRSAPSPTTTKGRHPGIVRRLRAMTRLVCRSTRRPHRLGDSRTIPTVTFNVLANDTDADGDPLTLTNAPTSSFLRAPVQCQPTGDCTYTPNSGFQGWDGFNYVANDGHDGTGGMVCIAVGNADGVAGEGFAVTRFATFPLACSQGSSGTGPIGVAFDATGRLY